MMSGLVECRPWEYEKPWVRLSLRLVEKAEVFTFVDALIFVEDCFLKGECDEGLAVAGWLLDAV